MFGSSEIYKKGDHFGYIGFREGELKNVGVMDIVVKN